MFSVGDRLTDRSVYLTGVSPVLEGEYALRTTGFENATVRLTATLLLRAADEDRVYWSDRRRLNRTTTVGVGADDPARVTFAVNVSTLRTRIASIRRQVGTTPGDTSATVVVNATISGADRTTTLTRRLGITPRGDTYRVTTNTPQATITRVESVRVPREPSPAAAVGGPVLSVAGLAGAVLLGFARVRGVIEPSRRQRARLQYLNDRVEFDEWIVTARLPDDDRPTAEADSLADLAAIAIDADTTVVHHADRYVAVTDAYQFVYHPPEPLEPSVRGLFGLPVSDSVGNSADSTSDEEAAPHERSGPADEPTADPDTEVAANGAGESDASGEPDAPDDPDPTDRLDSTDESDLTDELTDDSDTADDPADATDTTTAADDQSSKDTDNSISTAESDDSETNGVPDDVDVVLSPDDTEEE